MEKSHFNHKGAEAKTTGETTEEALPTPTETTPTPGETPASSPKETIPTGISKSACSAKSQITARKSVANGLPPISLVSTLMDAHSGQKSMQPPTPIQVKTNLLQSSPLRIFNSELDGTPTSSSTCHSANNYEFVCHLHCNL
jgi:hypothetical protein